MLFQSITTQPKARSEFISQRLVILACVVVRSVDIKSSASSHQRPVGHSTNDGKKEIRSPSSVKIRTRDRRNTNWQSNHCAAVRSLKNILNTYFFYGSDHSIYDSQRENILQQLADLRSNT